MAAPHGDFPLSQSAAACHKPNIDWDLIDDEFRLIINPLLVSLCSDAIQPAEAGDSFSEMLHSHLDHHCALRANRKSPGSCGPHRDRGIIKLTRRLAKVKNMARRSFNANPSGFLHGVHNKAVKAAHQSTLQRNTRHQEREFRSNPWSFSKSVCCPNDNRTAPTFSQTDCEAYFNQVFSGSSCSYTSLPSWVEEVCPPPTPNDSLVEFDLSPITPGYIKGMLKKCSSKSAPGDDGITYHHLKKLPSAHHFLATLFSKILLSSHQPPTSWCSAKTILIHKKGDPGMPNSFRPIALSSCVGKLFHKILARRLD